MYKYIYIICMLFFMNSVLLYRKLLYNANSENISIIYNIYDIIIVHTIYYNIVILYTHGTHRCNFKRGHKDLCT